MQIVNVPVSGLVILTRLFQIARYIVACKKIIGINLQLVVGYIGKLCLNVIEARDNRVVGKVQRFQEPVIIRPSRCNDEGGLSFRQRPLQQQGTVNQTQSDLAGVFLLVAVTVINIEDAPQCITV